MRSPMTCIMRVGSTELRPRLLGRLGRAGRLETLHLGLRLLRRRHVFLRTVFVPLRRAALHRSPHVALHDAAGGTGTVYLGEVEVVFVGKPTDYGRSPEVPVGPAIGLAVSLFPPASSSPRGPRSRWPWPAPPPSSSPPSSASASATGFATFGDLFTLALDKRYRFAHGHCPGPRR